MGERERLRSFILSRAITFSAEYRRALSEGRLLDAALLEVRIDELEQVLLALDSPGGPDTL